MSTVSYAKKVISGYLVFTFLAVNVIPAAGFSEEQRNVNFNAANLQTGSFTATEVQNREANAQANVANLNLATSSQISTSSAQSKTYLTAEEVRATGYRFYNANDPNIGYEVFYAKDTSGKEILNKYGEKLVTGVNEYNKSSGLMTKQCSFVVDTQKKACQVVSSIVYFDNSTSALARRDLYQWDSATNRSVVTVSTKYHTNGNVWKVTRYAFDNRSMPSKAILLSDNSQVIQDIFEYDSQVADQMTKRTKYQVSNGSPKVDSAGAQLLYSIEEFSNGKSKTTSYYRADTGLLSSKQVFQADGINLEKMESYDADGKLQRTIFFVTGSSKMKSVVEIDKANNVQRVKEYDSNGVVTRTVELPLAVDAFSYGVDNNVTYLRTASKDFPTILHINGKTQSPRGWAQTFYLERFSMGYIPFSQTVINTILNNSKTLTNYDANQNIFNGFLYPHFNVFFDSDNNIHVTVQMDQIHYIVDHVDPDGTEWATPVLRDAGEYYDIVMNGAGQVFSMTQYDPFYSPTGGANVTEYFDASGKKTEDQVYYRGGGMMDRNFYDASGNLTRMESYYYSSGAYVLRYIKDGKTGAITNDNSKKIYYDNRIMPDKNIAPFTVYQDKSVTSTGTQLTDYVYDASHNKIPYKTTLLDASGIKQKVTTFDPFTGKMQSIDYYAFLDHNGEVVTAHEDYSSLGLLKNKILYDYYSLPNYAGELIRTESFLSIRPNGAVAKDSSGKELVSYINEYAPRSQDPSTRSELPYHLQKVTTYYPNSTLVKTVEEFNNWAWGADSNVHWSKSSMILNEYYPDGKTLKASHELLLGPDGNSVKDSSGKAVSKTSTFYDDKGVKNLVVDYKTNVQGPIEDTDPKLTKFTAAYSAASYHVDASGNKLPGFYEITLYAADWKKLQTVTYNENNKRPIKSEIYDATTGAVIKSYTFDYKGVELERSYGNFNPIVPFSVNDSRFNYGIYPSSDVGVGFNLPVFTAAFMDESYKIDNKGVKHVLSRILYNADGKKLQEVTYDETSGNVVKSAVYDLALGQIGQVANFDGTTGLPTAVINYGTNPNVVGSYQVMHVTLYEGQQTITNSKGEKVIIPAVQSSFHAQREGVNFMDFLGSSSRNAEGKQVAYSASFHPIGVPQYSVPSFHFSLSFSDGGVKEVKVMDTSYRRIQTSKYDSQSRLISRTDIQYGYINDNNSRTENEWVMASDGSMALHKEYRTYDRDNKQIGRYVDIYDDLNQLIKTESYDATGKLIGEQPLNHHSTGTYYVKDKNGNILYKWVVTFTNLPTWAHIEEKWVMQASGAYLMTERIEFNSEDYVSKKTVYNANNQVTQEISYGSPSGFVVSSIDYRYSDQGVLIQKTYKDGLGKIEREEFFENGRPSTTKHYNKDTGKITQLDEYSNGNLRKSTGYDANGNITSLDDYNLTDSTDRSHTRKDFANGKLSTVVEWDRNGSKIRRLIYKLDGTTYDYEEKYNPSNGSKISKTTFYSDNKIYRVEEYQNNSVKDVLVYSYRSNGTMSKVDMYDPYGTLIRTINFNDDGTEIPEDTRTMPAMNINMNGLQASIDTHGKAAIFYEGAAYEAQVNMDTMVLTLDTGYRVISIQLKAKANGQMYCYSYSTKSNVSSSKVAISTSYYREDELITSYISSEGVDAFNQSITGKGYYSYDSQNRETLRVQNRIVNGSRYNKAFSEWWASYTVTDWTNNTKTIVEDVVVPSSLRDQINSTADYTKIDAYAYVKHEDKYQANDWKVKLSRTEWVKTNAYSTTFTKKAVIRDGKTYLLMTHSAGFTYELMSNIPSSVEGYTVRFGEAWQLDANGNKTNYLGYGFVFEKTPIGAYFPTEIIFVDYPAKTDVMLSRQSDGHKVKYTVREKSDGLHLEAPYAGDPYLPPPTTPTMTSSAQVSGNSAIVSASIMNMPNNATVSLRVTGSNGYNRQFTMQRNGGTIFDQAQYMSSVNSLVSGGYSYRIEIYDPAQTKVIASSQGNFVINYIRSTPCNGTVVNGVCIDRTTR